MSKKRTFYIYNISYSFYLKVVNFNYGPKIENHLENVVFYNTENPSKIVSIEKVQVGTRIFVERRREMV